MPFEDALLWIFLACAVMGYAVADRFDLHDYSKRWPNSVWEPVTPENRRAYLLFWGLGVVGFAAIGLRIWL